MSAGLVIVDTNEKLDIESQSNQEHSEDYSPRTPCEISLSLNFLSRAARDVQRNVGGFSWMVAVATTTGNVGTCEGMVLGEDGIVVGVNKEQALTRCVSNGVITATLMVTATRRDLIAMFNLCMLRNQSGIFNKVYNHFCFYDNLRKRHKLVLKKNQTHWTRFEPGRRKSRLRSRIFAKDYCFGLAERSRDMPSQGHKSELNNSNIFFAQAAYTKHLLQQNILKASFEVGCKRLRMAVRALPTATTAHD
ncbi:hypothetical protein B0H14DRAFT_2643675 [Mycena olivaceomarginata]|nr:hypothetical protein B0H14DRAFT_2643675 [Mycena olivaceomarginata]